MRPLRGRSRALSLAAVAVTAVVAVLGGGLVADDVHAGGAIVPQTLAEGAPITGSTGTEPITWPTTAYAASTVDGPMLLLSGSMGDPITTGTTHQRSEVSEGSTGTAIARVLTGSAGLASGDPIEIAAAQAAVWTLTDGFVLSETDGDNDPAVVARHRELLEMSRRVDPEDAPVPNLTLSPSTNSARAGEPVVIDIETDAADPLLIETHDPSVTVHPVTNGACDPDVRIDRREGAGPFCLMASGTPSDVEVDVRSPLLSRPVTRAFGAPGSGTLVGAGSSEDQAIARAGVSWSANAAPDVTVSCPAEGVNFDRPVTLVGSASDPDGDPLTWQWGLNGVAVSGARSGELTVELVPGDEVSLEVSDDRGGSATAVLDCGDARPPTVELSCATDRADDTDTFVAVADDPDDDEVTYRWTVDGSEVSEADGPTLTVAAGAAASVSVVAVDSTGLRSEPAAAACLGGNSAPTVTTTCPDDLQFGRPATFEATGIDPDGDTVTFSWSLDGTVVADASGPGLEVTLDDGQTLAVMVSDPSGAASTATFDCTGRPPNDPPVVGVVCPGTLVHGHRQVFVAEAADADGDALSYRWFVDDVEVPGETSAVAELVLASGQRVSAEATDGTTWSERATTGCRASARTIPPTVSVSCPRDLLWDENSVFVANGVDPADRGALVYTWMVNGVSRSEPGLARVTERLAATDVLSVVATTEDGVVSEPAVADCGGTHRPTVALRCPEGVTEDGPAAYRATGHDADSDPLTFEWSVDGSPVEGESGPEAALTMEPGSRLSVRAVEAGGLASADATSTCVGRADPTVRIECPSTVVDDEPRVLRAVGGDADDDSLTYTWSVDGEILDGVSGSSVQVPAGVGVDVTATDPTGRSSATATVECRGATRPVVDLSCPSESSDGAATVWSASVDADDGTAIAGLTWAVNGVIVPGVDGAEVELDTTPGETVSVNAASSDGLVSPTATRRCLSGGTDPEPSVTVAAPIPATDQILGTAALREALAVAQEPTPLARTGATVLRLLLVGLAAVASGLTLLVLGGAPRRRT